MSAASGTSRRILDTTGHACLLLPAPDVFKRRALALAASRRKLALVEPCDCEGMTDEEADAVAELRAFVSADGRCVLI